MNGFDPAMMQRMQQIIQQNPQIAALLQKPGLMQKLQAIASNPNDPMIAQQYASDPDVQQLIQILGPAMGINSNANNMNMGSAAPNFQNNGFGQYQHLQNPASQHQPQQQPQQSTVTYINSENQFLDIINKAAKDKLIVCDFFATWCGPCKAIAPEYERFARLYGQNAIFLKIDVDRNKMLAQNKKIAAMPTFQFYKNRVKIDEMRGANVSKLEQLITKHITVPNTRDSVSVKASPYSNFPLHEKNRPIYTKAPFKKMKDKLHQLNRKLIEDEKQQKKDNAEQKKYGLNEIELTVLEQMVNMLQDRASYASQEFDESQYDLLDKLLLWPHEMLPPVLDLIRVLSLHPSFAEHCSKHFGFVIKIIKIGGNGLINAVNGMLTCRIVINLFNRRITGKVLEQQYTQIVDNLLMNMKVNDRKNTRLAFVRVLLHYAYSFYVKGYNEKSSRCLAEKIRCFALFTEILYREEETDIILNILMGIGTLLFRDENVIQFAKSMDFEMVIKSYLQKYANEQDIVKCCQELIQATEKPQL